MLKRRLIFLKRFILHHTKYIQITILCGSRFPYPIGQMSDKIEEKVVLWNADDFIRDFHEQRESFRRSQTQSMCDVWTEILCPGARIHLKCFVCVIGEINFMENLCRFVLNRLHFNEMWRVLPLTDFQSLLESLHGIDRDRMGSCTQERCQLLVVPLKMK